MMLPTRKLLLFLIFTANTAGTDYGEAFQRYTESWWTVAQPGFEGLEKMRALAGRADTLLTLAGPVGAVIAAGAKVIFPPTSPEARAIEQLKTQIFEQNQAIRHALLAGFAATHKAMVSLSWDERVRTPVTKLEEAFNDVLLDPATMHLHTDDYKNRCKDNTPLSVLKTIYDLVVRPCAIPTEADVLLSISARKTLRRIESTLPSPAPHTAAKYADAKKDFIVRITQTQDSRAYAKLEKLTKAQPDTFEKLIELMKGEYDDLMQPACILSAVYEEADGSRVALDMELLQIEQTIKSLILYGGACLNITEDGNPFRIEAKRKELASIITEITRHAADWAEKTEETAWPLGQHERAKNQLWSLIPATAEAAAAVVQQAFETSGLKQYEYQTVAHPGSLKPGAQYVTQGSNRTYYCVKDTAGWTVHIYRFNYSDRGQRRGSGKRFKTVA
ncbi:unnamed protein product, partial [Mesorhabditis spiculigera]